jgi:hypothetical protein
MEHRNRPDDETVITIFIFRPKVGPMPEGWFGVDSLFSTKTLGSSWKPRAHGIPIKVPIPNELKFLNSRQ